MAGRAVGAAAHDVRSCVHACCKPLLSISIIDILVLPSGDEDPSPICNLGASSIALIVSGANVSLQTSYLPARAGNLPKANGFSEPAIRARVAKTPGKLMCQHLHPDSVWGIGSRMRPGPNSGTAERER